MLRRAARLSALFLALAALGYAQFGALLRFEARRADIQRSIKLRLKAGVPEDELTTFTLTAQQWRGLHWVKPGREFRLSDGRMFDVVRRADGPDGTVVLRCIADHEETALFAGLQEAVARNMDGKAPKGKDRVLRFLNALCHGPMADHRAAVAPETIEPGRPEEIFRTAHRPPPGVPPPRA